MTIRHLITASKLDYRNQHEAPDKEAGCPMHDLTSMYPDDVYTHPEYYAPRGPEKAGAAIALKNRGKPNARVTVYRALPKDLDLGINDGDWVTPVKAYAELHGRSWLRDGFRIVKKVVKARELFTEGNSLAEWGYDPR